MGVARNSDARSAAARRPMTIRSPTSAVRSRLRLLLIDALEIVEDRAAFVRCEPAELVPVWLPESTRALSRRVGVRGRESLISGRGLRLAFVAVLTLVLLERTAGIEQPAEQLLLPREGSAVDTPSLERFGELTRFLRQLRSAVAAGTFTEFVQLLGKGALLPRQRACCRLHLPGHLSARYRQQSLCLRVDGPLLLRHLLQLLEHLREARRGRRGVHALP